MKENGAMRARATEREGERGRAGERQRHRGREKERKDERVARSANESSLNRVTTGDSISEQ